LLIVVAGLVMVMFAYSMIGLISMAGNAVHS
jgi:hypothetical protein